jgi:predicted  nucleic acid-binding Zn-ribbon protein
METTLERPTAATEQPEASITEASADELKARLDELTARRKDLAASLPAGEQRVQSTRDDLGQAVASGANEVAQKKLHAEYSEATAKLEANRAAISVLDPQIAQLTGHLESARKKESTAHLAIAKREWAAALDAADDALLEAWADTLKRHQQRITETTQRVRHYESECGISPEMTITARPQFQCKSKGRAIRVLEALSAMEQNQRFHIVWGH